MMYHLGFQEILSLQQLALIQNISMVKLLVLDVELPWKLKKRMKMTF